MLEGVNGNPRCCGPFDLILTSLLSFADFQGDDYEGGAFNEHTGKCDHFGYGDYYDGDYCANYYDNYYCDHYDDYYGYYDYGCGGGGGDY